MTRISTAEIPVRLEISGEDLDSAGRVKLKTGRPGKVVSEMGELEPSQGRRAAEESKEQQFLQHPSLNLQL